MGNILKAANHIIERNCSITNITLDNGSGSDGSMDVVGPVRFDISSIWNITRAAGRGVSFALTYTEVRRATQKLNCSAFGAGNSLCGQLKDIFSNLKVVEKLGESIVNGSLIIIVSNDPRDRTTGLRTDAVIAIGIGAAAGIGYIAAVAFVIMKKGR